MVTLTVEDKCQSAETPRSSNLHVPLISQALHTKKGVRGRTRRSGRKIVTRPRRKVDEDEVRRDSPDVMVCSCNSGAHAYRDECACPYCQYWRCEGKEAGQKEQDMLCVVWGRACSAEMRVLGAAWRRGRCVTGWWCGDICHVCNEVESPAA